MQPDIKNIIVFILILLIGNCLLSKAQNVEVVISDIRSAKGIIVIGVFKDNQSFKEDKPYVRKKFKKTEITKGEMKIHLFLEPGTYGFALLDDENNDDKMNFNFIGIPSEGYGFSNYYLSGLSKPKFEAFKFELNENQNQKIFIRIKYMY